MRFLWAILIILFVIVFEASSFAAERNDDCSDSGLKKTKKQAAMIEALVGQSSGDDVMDARDTCLDCLYEVNLCNAGLSTTQGACAAFPIDASKYCGMCRADKAARDGAVQCDQCLSERNFAYCKGKGAKECKARFLKARGWPECKVKCAEYREMKGLLPRKPHKDRNAASVQGR